MLLYWQPSVIVIIPKECLRHRDTIVKEEKGEEKVYEIEYGFMPVPEGSCG